MGYSYSYISKTTKISKSTLSDWFSKLPYKPNKQTIARIGRARIASIKKRSQLKLDSLKKIESLAKKDIGDISHRDLFMLGLAVYIGEGTKSSGTIRIANADPRII